jgi:hypothetical protein
VQRLIKKLMNISFIKKNLGAANSGVKLQKILVSYVTSGLLDEDRKKVVSYLHKALKPINQLRMMEDSLSSIV